MKTLVLIQARMGGTRFPGKVKELLAGFSVLEHVARRARWMGYDTTIAVPPGPESDWSWTTTWRAEVGAHMKQPRATEDDVLGRLSVAAAWSRSASYSAIVRLTADCPFVPVSAIDAVAVVVSSGAADYAETRSDPSTRPNGIDAIAFTPALLERADIEERDRSAREHITPAVRSRASNPVMIDALEGILLDELPPFRITVDTPEDLDRLRGIAKWHASHGVPPRPSLTDLVHVYRLRPDLFLLEE